jgi:hypothetical protein
LFDAAANACAAIQQQQQQLLLPAAQVQTIGQAQSPAAAFTIIERPSRHLFAKNGLGGAASNWALLAGRQALVCCSRRRMLLDIQIRQ